MEIRYEPPKEIVIHHMYKVDVDELTRVCVGNEQGAKPAYWHNGILFIFHSIPMIINSDLVSDYIKGKEHWDEAYYAEMKEYSESLEVESGEFRGAKVRVIRVDDYSPHREFAEWLKKVK